MGSAKLDSRSGRTMVTRNPAEVRDRLRPLLMPVLAQADLDLEDIEVRTAGRRTLLRLLVDRDDGVTLDDIASISSKVSNALDDAGEMGEAPYTLEVSSPGVDRPLTLPRHWRRNRGRLVKVHRVDGQRITGRVRDVGEEAVELDVDGVRSQISYDDVAKARVEVEFARPDSGTTPGRKED